MKVFVVIPAYNEEKVIAEVISRVKSCVSNVVVVDDGSKDKTAEAASFAGAEVLIHPLNRGQGAAIQTGIDYSLFMGADIVATFDADGQHEVDDVKVMIDLVARGEVDVALGSRFARKDNKIPLSKNFILRFATFITQIYTGLKVTDTHNGLRVFSAQAAKKINLYQDGMAHASEILEQIGKYNLKYSEVPVKINYTEYSKNKGQKISNSFQIIIDLILSRLIK